MCDILVPSWLFNEDLDINNHIGLAFAASPMWFYNLKQKYSHRLGKGLARGWQVFGKGFASYSKLLILAITLPSPCQPLAIFLLRAC